MSTAWYKSRCIPQMVRSWRNNNNNNNKISKSSTISSLTIEVWDTTCIVTNDLGIDFPILINPGNPQLSGVSKFPYFPIGGPQPPVGFQISKDTHPIMGYVSQWGGMEVGNGMMFASNVIDGLVHQLGGKQLREECQNALIEYSKRQNIQSDELLQLKEGEAIVTSAVGNLLKETNYQYIVHVVPPFYKLQNNTSATTTRIKDDDDIVLLLAETYRNAIHMATTISNNELHVLRMACPLLGAGCRGFPIDVAVDVAVKTLMGIGSVATTHSGSNNTAKSRNSPSIDTTIAFGIPSTEIRNRLVQAFDREYERAIDS